MKILYKNLNAFDIIAVAGVTQKSSVAAFPLQSL